MFTRILGLQVLMEREIDNIGLDDEARKGMDPGAAIAMGCSMLVRMYVPLWVVNLTKVLISAALVEQHKQEPPPMAAARRLAYGTHCSSRLDFC